MLHRLNKTRAAKEGVIEPSAADLIRPFVAGPDEPPRYSLHFGTINKVGVNPNSEYDTPLAVCAYPLTQEIFDQFLRIGLPFAQEDAKYLFVLEIKPNARVFYSTERFFDLGVGPEYLGADLSNVNPRGSRNPFSEMFFYSTRPSDYTQKEQYFVEGGTAARAAQWGHKLWRMGIDVWVDADNEGILHENEPSQVMFFNPSSYRVVLALDNPKNTLEARFGRDWRRRKGIDLTGADLVSADLRGADLSEAVLHSADLTDADLRGADLSEAVLHSADLTDAKLHGAKLHGAKLRVAKLRGALLTGADLRDADLRGADLTYADLPEAYLYGAKLSGAVLNNANLRGAVLREADLTGIIYNDSTIWPYGFTPPPSAPRPNRR